MSDYRIEAIVAGILFITATGATMVSQMVVAPMLASLDVVEHVNAHRPLFVLGVMLEIINALASAGIAIAFFPILWKCAQILAPSYAILRAIEASVGTVAAVALLMLLTTVDADFSVKLHDTAFGVLLIVFSVSTLVLYPALFHFRIVPTVLSVWGLVGGTLLLTSNLLILMGQFDMGSTIDTFLSLPIWINEMVLALWLIFRGVELTKVPGRLGHQ